MLIFDEGPVAKYKPPKWGESNIDTHWCKGTGISDTNPRPLTSSSYNSCVGLVLFCSKTKVGAVAHFPGSLGQPENQKQAALDAAGILQGLDIPLEALTTAPLTWKAWVFGGVSLQGKGDKGKPGSQFEYTIALMKIVRAVLKTAPGVKEAAETLDNDSGYYAVSLELTNGEVTFTKNAKYDL